MMKSALYIQNQLIFCKVTKDFFNFLSISLYSQSAYSTLAEFIASQRIKTIILT